MSTILDRDQWLEKLVQIAANLGSEGPPIRLCVIGSVACVFGGMAARTTRDLDVWKPASDYDFMQLKQAVEGAGLAFDPKTTLEPGMPYLQLVEPRFKARSGRRPRRRRHRLSRRETQPQFSRDSRHRGLVQEPRQNPGSGESRLPSAGRSG